MPSVFPGMDPFIEGEEWESFHSRFISGISDALVPELRPDYLVRAERRIYVEHFHDVSTSIRPDIAVVRPTRQSDTRRRGQTRFNTAVLEPVERTLPSPVEAREKYLVIRRMESAEVVTVIEILSPANKRIGGEGREAYLAKRTEVLQSQTNLVEVDLLRGGARLPTIEPLPPGDYYAFVCRSERRYRADVYAWPLPHRLPVIPIPLAAGDREIPLDLQAVFGEVFDRIGYDYSLDYRRPMAPALDRASAQWVRDVLKRQGKAGAR